VCHIRVLSSVGESSCAARIAARRTGSFPSPPIVRTVLDVGCHSGFYCFMAASEEAKYCLGVDIDERHLSRAKGVLKPYNIPNVHFINEDVLESKFPRECDVVLCLNLLPYLRTLDRVDALLKALPGRIRNL
jgi:SAM-dependent methyltransferase